MAVLVVGTVLIGLGSAWWLSSRPSATTPGVTPATAPVAPVSLDQGTVVFSDGFANRRSGWPDKDVPGGPSYHYEKSSYVISTPGPDSWWLTSPYRAPQAQLSTSVAANIASGRSAESGYGVLCKQGAGESTVRYELVAYSDGGWTISRSNGTGGATSYHVVDKGTSTQELGSVPVTVEGACLTARDAGATRLVLFVAGSQVADVVDTNPGVTAGGWRGGLVTSSRPGSSTVLVVTRVMERSLAVVLPTAG